jgi:hypothetical protein
VFTKKLDVVLDATDDEATPSYQTDDGRPVPSVTREKRPEVRANAQAILMSLFRSMELHGRNPVDEVLRLAQTAVAGKPLVLPLSPDEADQIAA